MGSDRGRRTYDRTRQYRSVVMQQGRVTLEADWNEAQDIVNEAIREQTLDFVGRSGTSDDGYRIIETGRPPDPAFDFSVGAGTLYVGGARVALDVPVPYGQQPELEWLDHSSDPEWQDLPAQAVSEFVYLSLREQEVGAVEDSALREVALGGPDTAARTRLIQHIVRRGTDATDSATALGEAASVWLARGVSFEAQSMRLLSQATLQVGFQSQPVAPNPCEPEVQGGYLGAENQLIRVQISSENRLVWGFDNASFLYRVDVIDAKTLQLKSRPVDASHEPRQNQAVEVLRSAAQLSDDEYVASATGFITTLTAAYDPDSQKIVLAVPLPPEYRIQSTTPPIFLRVWEEELDFTPGTAVALGATGLQVTVRSQDGGRFYIGDYWLFAVRPGTPTQVYPQRYLDPQPPDGPRLWVCPLALITWNGGVLQVIEDCRNPFSPLTQAIPALHVKFPNWTNDDFFPLDTLQTTGLRITLDGIPVQTSRSLSPATMIVTLEIPVAAPDASVGSRESVILEGSITVENNSINWMPKTTVLNALLSGVPGVSRVRIVLKGHTIWSMQGSQTLYLDGQALGKLGPDRLDPVIGDGTLTPRIDLEFPTGAGARASDFESWFYLGRVQPQAPTLVSVLLHKNVKAVFAGQTLPGTVTLSHAAPKDVGVSVQTSDADVAVIKDTVVVTKGQTQGSFTVSTRANIPATTDIVIRASLDTGVPQTAPLTVEVVQVKIEEPREVTLPAGDPHNFTARARTRPDASDTGVNWSVEGGGSVFPLTGPETKYTAPTVVETPAVKVTVRAQSKVDPNPTRSDFATVNVQRKVSVSIPTSLSEQVTGVKLEPNRTRPTTAKVTGTNNTAVTWEIFNPPPPTGGSFDTVTATSCVYRAPSPVPDVRLCHVRARSIVDPSKVAELTIQVGRLIVVPGADLNDGTGGRGGPGPLPDIQANAALPQTSTETLRPDDGPPKKRKRGKKTRDQSSERAKDDPDE